MFPRKLAATGSIALLSLTALVGCGSGGSGSDSESPSASASSSSSSPSAGASASASASSSSAVEPTTPQGTKLITASTNKVSFALPDSYEDLNDPATKQHIIDRTQDEAVAEQVTGQAKGFDAFYMEIPDHSTDFNNNVNVGASPVGSASAVPTKQEIEQNLGSTIKANFGEYRTVQTSLGEGAQIAYTMDVQGTTVHGVMMFLPNAEDQLVNITVSADTADAAAAIADDVVASYRAA